MPLPMVPMPKYAIFVIIDPPVVLSSCPLGTPLIPQNESAQFKELSTGSLSLTQIMTHKVLENVT